ncbi:MAG: hypothetical protein H7255_18580 [Ramlibacter sp.]|nr:hypothetical protein [Ramlibacter sp.]
MTKPFDLIATGTGASGAAASCRKAGWKAAVVDNLPFGGICALRGCFPKEVLVGVAQALDRTRRTRGKEDVFNRILGAHLIVRRRTKWSASSRWPSRNG